jgi:septal ring factor EnvC (AmiA/AmiB activator)
MMKRILYTLLILFTAGCFVQGQTVQELERRRKETLQQLETTSKILSETKKDQRNSLNKLNVLNRNIQERNKLINNIEKEIGALEREMNTLTTETRKMERELQQLKKDYANTVRETYVSHSIYSKIMFVLSADNFDQSFRRMRYLQEFANYRKHQAAEIERTKTELQQKTELLAAHKLTQEEIRQKQASERKKLEGDKRKEDVALGELKKKEGSLRKEQQRQQKIANDLNRKIEQLIAEEIRKQEEKAKKEKTVAADKSDTKTSAPARSSGTENTLTKEQKLISGNFAANAGRLPWPTERGFISGKFGVQPHPVLKYVTINNKGIYIQTPSGTQARAVFEGVVTNMFTVSASNYAIIVQHGQYRTVYSNLTDVLVRVGQKVSAKQNLGRIYTDPDNDNKTEMYFQIWKDRNILNPESWIAR